MWRRSCSTDVIEVLTDLFLLRGILAYIRFDNGPELVEEAPLHSATVGNNPLVVESAKYRR